MKIELIFAIFALVGALDKITGNRFKLGDEFDKGVMSTGPLILAMSGMIVLAPVIASGLSLVFGPLLNLLHIDLSILAAFFPVDSGGASMAHELSDDIAISGYNGIVVASMFGAALCPGIPISLQIVEKEYHEDVLIGLLCGFATIPFGCIISGIMLGIGAVELILNTLLIIVISFIICLGLWKCPRLSGKIFGILGKVLMVFITVGLVVGIFHQLTDFEIMKNTVPITDSFIIIGNIAIILAGVFPLLTIISRVFNKYFLRLGNALKLDNMSVIGLVTILANYIPVFSMIKDMNKKGRIMNMAFCVSAAFILGDHLAFVLAFDRAFVLPMVIGKIISGVLSLVMATIVYNRMEKNKKTFS